MPLPSPSPSTSPAPPPAPPPPLRSNNSLYDLYGRALAAADDFKQLDPAGGAPLTIAVRPPPAWGPGWSARRRVPSARRRRGGSDAPAGCRRCAPPRTAAHLSHPARFQSHNPSHLNPPLPRLPPPPFPPPPTPPRPPAHPPPPAAQPLDNDWGPLAGAAYARSLVDASLPFDATPTLYLAITSFSQPAHGSVALDNATGEFTYSLTDASFKCGEDRFAYTIKDRGVNQTATRRAFVRVVVLGSRAGEDFPTAEAVAIEGAARDAPFYLTDFVRSTWPTCGGKVGSMAIVAPPGGRKVAGTLNRNGDKAIWYPPPDGGLDSSFSQVVISYKISWTYESAPGVKTTVESNAANITLSFD